MNRILAKDAKTIADSKISWDKLSGKTVLITGATGFIGSSIIHTIMCKNVTAKADIHIIAMVRSRSRGRAMYEEYEDTGLLTFIENDVCNPVSYRGDVDFIIHCASNAAPKEYATDPTGTMKTNFFGTFNLLDFAKEKNVEKFLYVSTIEVYGTTSDIEQIGEDDFGYINATLPRSCYPISKKACETACVSYGVQFGVPVSIGRLSYIFGPGMKINDSKIVAILARNAAKQENLVLKSKGEQMRSYTYIADAISGLLTVMLAGENNEAYNISSSLCKTTIVGIADTLADIYKETGIEVKFDLPSEEESKNFTPIKDAVLDNTKLKSLGWSEAVDLRQGLINMVDELKIVLED